MKSKINCLHYLLLLIFYWIGCSFINYLSHGVFYFYFHAVHSQFLLRGSSYPFRGSMTLLRLKKAFRVLGSGSSRFFISLWAFYLERLLSKSEMLLGCCDLHLLNYLDCLRNLWFHREWYLCYHQTEDYHQSVASNLLKICYPIVTI